MRYPDGCILQFTKSPVAGEVKTRLIPALGAEGALDLHRQLTRQTLEVALGAKVSPVQLWVSEKPEHPFFQEIAQGLDLPIHVQQGLDLGERMTNAIAVALEKYRYVLLIGSDCPVLSGQYLEAAMASLVGGADICLGPAIDGGYVLIGARGDLGDALAGVDWGTSCVLKQTMQNFDHRGMSVELLPELWDVDTEADYQRMLALDACG